MYIKKMDITSFGKYQDREINLTDGINLIYGDNEAGKSTIHKFVEGMLYGFYKPYRKNKQFSADYERFLPWNNSNKYKGILIYEHLGREYRIERNFMKRNDKVEIFDNITGENITGSFEYDNATKLYQPASRHMGINKSTFNNTISIGQLSSKTSDELVKEVKDSLINLGESKDEEISVRNVIEKLNKKLNEIGTVGRKKTTPYGKLSEEIKELKKEKTKAEKIWEKIIEKQQQLNSINSSLREMEKRKKDNEELLEYLNKEEIKIAYEDGVKLKQYIESKASELKDKERYKDVDIELIEDTIKKLNNLEVCKQQQEELQLEITEIDNYLKKQYEIYSTVKMLENEDLQDIDTIASQYNIYSDMVKRYNEIEGIIQELKVSLDYENENISVIEDEYEYTRLEEERKELKYSESGESVLKEQEYHNMISKQKQKRLISIISLLGFGGFLSGGIVFSEIIAIILSVVFAVISIYTIMSQKRDKGKMDIVANEINIIKSSQAKKQDRLDKVMQKQDEILARYQCTEVTELRRLKDKVLHRNVLHEENKKRYKKASSDLEKLGLDKREKQEKLIYYVNLILDSNSLDINNINLVKEKCEVFKDTKKNINHKNEDKKNRLEKYNNISERITILNKQIDEVADKYNVRDEKGLQQIKANKYLYHSILDTINNKKELLNRLLGDNTLEDLEQKLEKYNKAYITTEKSKEELLLEQDSRINDILHISKDITSYETKIANLQKDVRPIVDIEGDISNKLNIKSEYDKKIKALTMARDAIENISRDIQNNFAPKLNEKVSKIIGNITNRKYTDIKINPNMEILTYEPENHALISIDSLSKGTIDQMYFGLRLGLIDIIKEDKKLPLILDDCFVQYDNDRLKMVMETLGNLNRQIIILSCHRREEKILRDINADFNYIAL